VPASPSTVQRNHIVKDHVTEDTALALLFRFACPRSWANRRTSPADKGIRSITSTTAPSGSRTINDHACRTINRPHWLPMPRTVRWPPNRRRVGFWGSLPGVSSSRRPRACAALRWTTCNRWSTPRCCRGRRTTATPRSVVLAVGACKPPGPRCMARVSQCTRGRLA
jgi:hypothetical protein